MALTKVDARLLTGAIVADDSGNLGLGVTPSAWGSGITVLEMPNSGFLAFANSSGNISTNTYFDTAYKYKATAAAARYGQAAGAHVWYNAPSGTAGGTITWTQAMTLDNSGILTTPKGGCQVISGTSVSASSTAVNFTGIPSWVKKITVMFSGVSTNGSSFVQVQIGTSAGFVTSGYAAYAGVSSGNGNITTGFTGDTASSVGATWFRSGAFVLTLANPTTNLWVASESMGLVNGATGYGSSGGGFLALSGTLDRIRITTVNGTDTFDAGTINILYE